MTYRDDRESMQDEIRRLRSDLDQAKVDLDRAKAEMTRMLDMDKDLVAKGGANGTLSTLGRIVVGFYAFGIFVNTLGIAANHGRDGATANTKIAVAAIVVIWSVHRLRRIHRRVKMESE